MILAMYRYVMHGCMCFENSYHKFFFAHSALPVSNQCLLFSYCPQVAWEVVPELDPPLPSFTDLLFLGSRGSAVSDFQSRDDTETLALAFSGQANSLVTVPSQYHPPTVNNQLTLRYIT